MEFHCARRYRYVVSHQKYVNAVEPIIGTSINETTDYRNINRYKIWRRLCVRKIGEEE